MCHPLCRLPAGVAKELGPPLPKNRTCGLWTNLRQVAAADTGEIAQLLPLGLLAAAPSVWGPPGELQTTRETQARGLFIREYLETSRRVKMAVGGADG